MLTNAQIRAARPTEKPYKLSDGDGLALLVKPNGKRLWRHRFFVNGTERMLSLGAYPAVSLALAREKRDEQRRLLAAGIDPSADRKAKRAAHKVLLSDYLEPWAERHGKTQRESTRVRDARIIKAVNAELGKRSVVSITAADIVSALQAIQERHGREDADRAHSFIRRVLAAPLAEGKIPANPAAGIDRDAALGKRAKAQKRPGIVDPQRFAELLRAIDA